MYLAGDLDLQPENNLEQHRCETLPKRERLSRKYIFLNNLVTSHVYVSSSFEALHRST